MRILLTSDWQLGAGADLGQGDYGPGSRFQDQVDALDRIFHIAVEENVYLVAMLGDAFERARPAPQEILAVQDFVRRMVHNGIRVLFLRGNHDARGTVLPSALEIFQGNGCVVSMLPSMFPMEDIVICTLPWVPPGAIVAAMPDVGRDDVNDAAARGLVAGALRMLEECRETTPDLKPILVGHWAISGAQLPTGLDTAMLREPVIPLDALSESGFALAMFGHIHNAGMIAAAPTPVGYCGTPYVCNWAEAESPHGVWVYDSGASSLRFVDVPDNRRFLTIEPEFREMPSASGDAWGMVLPARTELSGATVRVKYTVTEEQARRITPERVREDFITHGADKVIVRPTVVREQRARVAAMADDLTETAALDLWLDSQGINGDTAKALHEAHAGYLTTVRA